MLMAFMVPASPRIWCDLAFGGTGWILASASSQQCEALHIVRSLAALVLAVQMIVAHPIQLFVFPGILRLE
jgi:hypothetical protein